jgi:hypothetical protein
MTLMGQLNARVDVRTLQVGKVQGARTKTYIPKYQNLAARINPIGPRHSHAGGGHEGNNEVLFNRSGLQRTHRIYIGAYGGVRNLTITQADEIVFGNRVFEVVEPMNVDELSRYLILDCREKQA